MYQPFTLYNPGLTIFLLKEDEPKAKCSGIINLLIAHILNTTQLIKHPCILSCKTLNKVYLSLVLIYTPGYRERDKMWSKPCCVRK